MAKIIWDQSMKANPATDEIYYSKGSPNERVISPAHDKYGRFIGGEKERLLNKLFDN